MKSKFWNRLVLLVATHEHVWPEKLLKQMRTCITVMHPRLPCLHLCQSQVSFSSQNVSGPWIRRQATSKWEESREMNEYHGGMDGWDMFSSSHFNWQKLSTILTLQDLERSRSLWPHVGPGYCSCGSGVLFMGHVYCSSGPAYYSSGAAYYSSGAAYKIYLIIFYIKNNMILYTAFTCSSSTVCIL